MLSSLGLIPANDPYQRLRLRRFLAASAVYLALIMLGAIYVHAGLMMRADWLAVSAAIIGVNLVLFVVLRSGRNEQLADPSLTVLQMIAASVLIATICFHVDGGRGGILLILMALLMFGAFRLHVGTFLKVGAFAAACFAGVIVLLSYVRPAAVDWHVATIHFLALVTVVPYGALFVAYAGDLRRRLRRRQYELQRARETVHELSIQDSLTGVHNRAEIVRLLDEERLRAQRLDTSLAIAILDLDEFKQINRRYTHAIGDAILQRVARVIDGELRAVDALGRYGGEEFLVILPDTMLDGGRESMEVVRRLLEERSLQDIADGLSLSVSIGVASYRAPDDTEALIERARASADKAFEEGGGQVATEEVLKPVEA